MRPPRSDTQMIESGPHARSHGVSSPDASVAIVKSSVAGIATRERSPIAVPAIASEAMNEWTAVREGMLDAKRLPAGCPSRQEAQLDGMTRRKDLPGVDHSANLLVTAIAPWRCT